jgi:hypothetical protein
MIVPDLDGTTRVIIAIVLIGGGRRDLAGVLAARPDPGPPCSAFPPPAVVVAVAPVSAAMRGRAG